MTSGNAGTGMPSNLAMTVLTVQTKIYAPDFFALVIPACKSFFSFPSLHFWKFLSFLSTPYLVPVTSVPSKWYKDTTKKRNIYKFFIEI
jgi:hypothetical protein